VSARHDPYAHIAPHYDRQMMDWYATTYGRRLQALLEERALAGSKILDAGCGTGTLALALADAGYDVTGVDLSEALLAVARTKDRRGAVRWVQGDITALELAERFDLVTSVADVLNHLESLDEWERAFRRFAAHLQPGGHLFFDVLTTAGLERMDVYSVEDRPGRVQILGIIWEPASRRSTLKITSFVPAGPGGLYTRASDTITEWAQPVAGILERLACAGFAAAERLWTHADDPESEERLAVLARRV
jgi:SAM-dependent methyltransferase